MEIHCFVPRMSEHDCHESISCNCDRESNAFIDRQKRKRYRIGHEERENTGERRIFTWINPLTAAERTVCCFNETMNYILCGGLPKSSLPRREKSWSHVAIR